jgi:FkbM family methyltransferase
MTAGHQGMATVEAMSARAILSRLRQGAGFIFRTFYPSIRERRTRPWFSIRGDKTLRIEYDLKQEDVVFDVGGYEGQWASDVFSKYCCLVHVFEPVAPFVQQIAARFRHNPRISVHPFGLSGLSRTERILIAGDGSSLFRSTGTPEEIKLVRASDFLAERGIDRIRLMKINIEGGEYELLEHLIETGLIRNISDVQIQFHDFVPDALDRMRKIQNALSRTHYPTYQYEFVWENWRRMAG